MARFPRWAGVTRWARFNVQLIVFGFVALVFVLLVVLTGSPAHPVGVICVIDISGSVAHELPSFKAAANWIIERLTSHDTCALIAVGHEARIVKCAKTDTEGRAGFASEISELVTCPEQGTDLDMALKLANQAVGYIAPQTGGYAPLLVMFTDGYDDLHVFTDEWHAPPVVTQALVYVVANEAYGENSLIGALQRVGSRYVAYPPGGEALALGDIAVQIEHMRGGPGWGRAVATAGFGALFTLLACSLIAWVAALIWPLPGSVIDGFGEGGLTYKVQACHRLLDWMFPRGWTVLATGGWLGPADIRLTPNPADLAPSPAAVLLRRTWRRYERVLEAVDGHVQVDGLVVGRGMAVAINAPAVDETRYLMDVRVVTVEIGAAQAIIEPQ